MPLEADCAGRMILWSGRESWSPVTHEGDTRCGLPRPVALGVRAKPLAPRRRRRLCYFESGRRSAARLLTKDEARQIAVDAGLFSCDRIFRRLSFASRRLGILRRQSI